MHIYYDESTGKILCSVPAKTPTDYLPANVGTPMYLDDTQYAQLYNNGSPDLTNWTVQNGAPVYTPIPQATLLVDAQTAKIAQLRQNYIQSLSQGFQYTFNTATPTTVTFGWSTDDKTNLLAVQESITDGFLTFPILYSDIHGVPVNIPDQVTLTSIKSKASSFFSNQHQQILNLISQVQSATTVSAVQAITWTPAAY